MKKPVKQFIIWAPRVLGILFALFISLFALDVFGAGYSFWETLLAFLIHLIPTGLVLIALALGWRWDWLGGILFIGLGIGYIAMAWGKFDLLTYLLISGPLFLIGSLFVVNGLLREERQSKS